MHSLPLRNTGPKTGSKTHHRKPVSPVTIPALENVSSRFHRSSGSSGGTSARIPAVGESKCWCIGFHSRNK